MGQSKEAKNHCEKNDETFRVIHFELVNQYIFLQKCRFFRKFFINFHSTTLKALSYIELECSNSAIEALVLPVTTFFKKFLKKFLIVRNVVSDWRFQFFQIILGTPSDHRRFDSACIQMKDIFS